MKAWTFTAAALATLALAAGCTEDGPGSVAAVPDPEPGDPAIYAPDGWPLQIGDKVSIRKRRELNATVPGLGNVEAINVVAGRTYGARWGSGDGFLPDEDFSDPQLTRMRSVGFGSHYIYEGHFRETVADTYWQYERDRLPEHLHGRIEYHEEIKNYDHYGHDHWQQRWEEERAEMRGDGLLPTPAQRSPERKR